MAFDAMVHGTLASGRLVRLFDTDTIPGAIYSVACAKAHADDPMIRSFRDRLHEEVRRSQAATAPMSAAQ